MEVHLKTFNTCFSRIRAQCPCPKNVQRPLPEQFAVSARAPALSVTEESHRESSHEGETNRSREHKGKTGTAPAGLPHCRPALCSPVDASHGEMKLKMERFFSIYITLKQ